MLRYGGESEEELDTSAIIEHLDFLDEGAINEAQFALVMAGDWYTLRERQDLFQQHQELEKIFVLVEGSMHLSSIETDENGRQKISLRRTVEPGEMLGRYDLLYRNPHSVRARALEPSRLLGVDATAINRLIFQFPYLRNRIAPLNVIGRMRTMPFFAGITLIELSFIADTAEEKTLEKGELLYSQDEALDNIYLVSVGQVKLTWGDGRELWIANGSAFGFCEERRSPWDPWLSDHDAVTETETELLVIPRRALFDIANLDADAVGTKLRKEQRETIQRLTIFRKFPEAKCDKLLGFMNYYHIAGHHHLLMQQGEVGDSLWILMPGRKATMVSLNSKGREIAKSQVYGPTYFSEAALRVQRYLEATVDAEPDSEWLRLHWKDFRMFLHEDDESLVDQLTMTVDVESLLGTRESRELYPWLEEGEQLIEFRRRHWIALVSQLIIPSVITIFVLITWIVLGSFLPAAFGIQLFVWVPILILLVVVWLWGIADYYNDYILVTNRRIVRQEKVILINELRQSAFLRQIQNVEVARSFLGSMLGYGTVNIQTAGAGGAIIFERLGEPDTIRDAIFRERSNHRAQYQAEGKMVIQNVLEERLGLTLQMPSRVRLDADAILFGEEEKSYWDRLVDYFQPDMPQNWTDLDEIRWRKHWFILIRNLTVPVLTTLASVISVLLLFSPVLIFPALSTIATPLLAIPTFIVGLAGLGWIVWEYVDWKNDQYIVSGDEVVDLEKKPLFFAEERKAARLDDIENVQLKMTGPINFILNFGDVELKTAATDGDFTFDFVPNPRAVAEEIRRRIENVNRQIELDRARSRAEELPDWFETYNRLDAERDPRTPGGI